MAKHNLMLLFASITMLFTMGASQADRLSNTELSHMDWLATKDTYFKDKTIHKNADKLLVIEAPKRAEDAATVPISVKSLVPQTADRYIKNIHLVIDRNPEPYSAKFRLSPTLGLVDIATRVRVEQYTFIRAIAEMNDGSLHMVSRFVKASGGCAAPILKDAAAAQSSLGKMKIRMRQPNVGNPIQTQVMVSHPNYNGLQFNQQLRRYIKAHYVKNIDIRYNGESLINVDTGISISQDPSIRFTFTPSEGGTISANVIDNQNQTFSAENHI